jgi:ABC-2 type transport system permease protein
MKQFSIIFKFEFKNHITNKVFVGVTLFLMAAITILMFSPRVLSLFRAGDDASTTSMTSESSYSALQLSKSSRPVLLLAEADDLSINGILEVFQTAFPDYEVQMADADLTMIEDQITAGEVACAFVLESPTSYYYYVGNLSMYDSNTDIADEALQTLYRMNAIVGSGISAADAQAILSTQVWHQTETLGKDQGQNYFYTYIMIFALYIVIMLYGQLVASNVATEKSSRAMELLITSAEPTSMMFGKVIASCLAGLLQLVAVFGTSIICYNLNASNWDESGIVASFFGVPLQLLIYMLVFFVLGYVIYAFLFGAVGSTVSRIEDINTAVQPITFFFVAAFMVVMFSLASNNVDTPLMIICSYVPFTSPMAMFARIAMSVVPWYAVAASIAILILSLIAVGVLSARIYRVGVLLYGTPPKPRALLRAIRNM